MGVGRFVTRFDAVPEFWQFLNGLTGADLIAELIQNELDADSTHTVIAFTASSLLCRGNGASIDAEGWERLSVLRGAGDEVAPKRNRIGVKNHGLKACFTIGDEIHVRSDGKMTVQTLYANGPDRPPYPAAFEFPIPDPTAPMQGCEVEVTLRTKTLKTAVGEPLEFDAANDEKLAALFTTACADIPRRFLGIIHPSFRHQYTLTLEHHRLGTANFEFRLRAGRGASKDMCFHRQCRITGTAVEEQTRAEIAYGAYVKWPHDLGNASNLYRPKRNTVYVEVACELDKRGRPSAVDGLKRYPISYTGDAPSAKSGRGVHYSAPFVSDQERHGAAGTTANAELSALCDRVLIRFLRNYLVGKFGAQSLSVAIAPGEGQEQAVRAIVEQMLSDRAVPLMGDAVKKLRFGPRRVRGRTEPVVVPSYSWRPGTQVKELQRLCPSQFDQIDPDVPPQIVSALADQDVAGWTETHVTFDENDVIARLQPEREAYFPWESPEQWQRSLADLEYSKAGLDVVLQSLDHQVISKDDASAIRESLYVAGADGTAHALRTLYASIALPRLGESLRLPPLIHSRLAPHPLFRRPGWRLPKYSIEKFVDDLQASDLAPRDLKNLWLWVKSAANEIPATAWRQIAQLPIWTSSTGARCTFVELCEPRDPSVKRVLAHVLLFPHRDVKKVVQAPSAVRGRLRVRGTPIQPELERYYASSVTAWPLDEELPLAEKKAFQQFEDTLAHLASEREISRMLVSLPSTVTLARDGCLRRSNVLHKATPEIAQLMLQPRDLAARDLPALSAVYQCRTRVSADAIVRALQCTPELQSALFPRLKVALQALHLENRNVDELSQIRCVPHDGTLVAPGNIALRGNRGDFWSTWKTSIASNTFSYEEALLLRQCGALPAEPTSETSVAFFRWLQAESQECLRQSVPMALRHLLHRHGVQSWWHEYPTLKCILVERNSELQLVSYSDMCSRNSHVYVPDFEPLADAIRDGAPNDRVLLAVINNPRVTESCAEVLRNAGAKSLYGAARASHNVKHALDKGENGFVSAIVNELRSPRMAGLRKKLASLQFPVGYLRDQWRERLRSIRAVRITDRLMETYRVGGRDYPIEVDSAFDEQSGELWLVDAPIDDLVASLFEVLSDRVFDAAPRYAAAVLRSAITIKYDERSWAGDQEEAPDHYTEEHSSAFNGVRRESATHGLRVEAGAPDLPDPRPLPNEPSRKARERLMRSTGGSQREPVQLEMEQVQELKALHYVWHCQICLSRHSPDALAPKSSYVGTIGNRQQIIDAHHPDQVHARGARHAGNIVILCHAHHHEIGDALSRNEIYHALLGACEKSVTFALEEATRTIIGFEATVHGPDDGCVKIFFTPEHRDYWLRAATQDGMEDQESA